MNYLENILGKDNSFWKYLAVCVITFIVMQLIGGIFIGIAVVLYLFCQGGEIAPELFSSVKSLYEMGLPENFVLILMIFPFVAGIITVWLLIGSIHKRTFSMTVNGRENIRWKHIFAGFLFWFLLMLVFFGISYIADPDNYSMQFDGAKFVALFIITLLFIPFQTTFEEFVFRGYLAQGIAAWTKNRWLVICIPALLFGLSHYQNTEVAEHGFWLAMPQYIIFGLFFGLIAVLDDGIELPLGMHAANNIFVCLFVTNNASSLRTPAIFSQATVDPILETVSLLIVVSLTTLFFYRKYKWDFHILNEKVK
ncbi:MAG: CPBP family intramembrane metalloprotease [Prevotellaceae bacterium]|jgi:membrane protease YdiL (CAAX protease family)|nr:CPBP family intramembrane metalloprotease [Prevotellaceae bacterium]